MSDLVGHRGCPAKISTSGEWPYAWCFGEKGHPPPHRNRHGEAVSEIVVVPAAEVVMKTITTKRDDGNEADQLDGVDLHNGEVIEIGWPDQSITCEVIQVVVTTGTAHAQGDTWTTTQRHAYVNGKYRGHHVRVRLAGLLGHRGRDLRARGG